MESRWHIWRAILGRPAWRWLVLIPLGLLGTFQALREEFLSSEHQAKLRLLNFIPHWPWWVWFTLFLIALVFIILESAYQLIKAKQQLLSNAEQRIHDLTTPVLSVTDGSDRNSAGDLWLRLKVYNPRATPAQACFGSLRRFRRLPSVEGPVGLDLPRAGHGFPWQTLGGNCELERTLPARKPDYLDIAVGRHDALLFHIVGVGEAGGRSYQSFTNPLPPGAYEAVIQVGSDDCPPTFVAMTMTLMAFPMEGGQQDIVVEAPAQAKVDVREVPENYLTNS